MTDPTIPDDSPFQSKDATPSGPNLPTTPPSDADLWEVPASATASSVPVTSYPVRADRRRTLLLGLLAVLAVGGVVAGMLVVMGGSSDDDASVVLPASDDVTSTVAAVTTVATTPDTSVAPSSDDAVAAVDVPDATDPPASEPPTTTATTTATTTTTATVTSPAAPTYPTLPDGSPEPIVAIYDGPTIRITGWVPSVEKAAQLEALALANSTDPAAQIDSTWSVDPSVPLSIGTRVIEMNSPRFAPGSSSVTPEHSEQLDRVAGVMNLLPNVTATVVGHADQQGDPAVNYALSEARAVSVVRYLVGQGVDPARLSSRAVGDQDLLSDEQSEASLALNRRTEFVFVGLLAD